VSSGLVRWVLVHLNDWTWFVAEYRVWLIVLATVIGGVAPLLSATRKRLPPAAPSRVIRSAAMALALSAAVVASCSLLHFSDLRWLPVNQRGSLHVSAPGGFLGFTKPAVTVINSVAGLPAEWRATQVAVHTAIVCAFLAVAGLVLMLGTWRGARRADIRQIVQEEIRKAAVVSRLCGHPECVDGSVNNSKINHRERTVASVHGSPLLSNRGQLAWRVSLEERPQGIVEFAFGFQVGKVSGAVDQDQFGALEGVNDLGGHRVVGPGIR
jgi:hypothetical protein